ncbi:MAG: nucleoid-associated protein [Candidatus Dadabacteria bacterium]
MDTPIRFIKKIIVHYVGSKNNLDPVYITPKALELDDESELIIQDSFLSRFKNNTEYYSFNHASSLQFNEVYQFSKSLFEDSSSFEEVSASIAQHLYENSAHPKVKGGEFYVAYFEGLPVESRVHKAIGLFKTENKSIFFDVEKKKAGLQLQMKEGVEVNKIDKGCLIINNNEEAGYDVLIFDNQNRGEEAQYWKEKFLSLTQQQSDFHHTSHLMSMAKLFIQDHLDAELKVPKTEQIEYLHKSLDYFKGNETFDINHFQDQVFGNEEVIDSFRRFGGKYVENTDYDIAASFGISPDAVKKQSRIYKSVLKLDRNFHVYIHGRTDLIEKGVDLDGRKYYKIYYQEES